ncbi:MAG: hypothetical protein V7K32_07155 [Nostoc sp.]
MTDNAIVLTDNAIVLTDNAIVLTDNAIVLTDNAIVLTDNAIVLTDNAIVSACKNQHTLFLPRREKGDWHKIYSLIIFQRFSKLFYLKKFNFIVNILIYLLQ